MSRLLTACGLMGALRAMAEPGCVLRLDFEGDADKRLACRETGARGVVAGQITIEGKQLDVAAGQMIIMPADKPHALTAAERFKMLLTMIRS